MGALSVAVNGVRIGYLEEFEEYRQQFTFDTEYCRSLITSRPILGQIFEDRFPSGILVDGPICWFSHLLPQGVMRNWRCELLDIDSTDNFALLEALGSDLPGAIVLTKANLPTRRPEGSLKQSKKQLSDLLKFSLAGAQWKLSARSSGRGLTTSAHSNGKSFIAKFHSPQYPDLPRREFATMIWAKVSGIKVPRFRLATIEEFDELPDELPTGDGNVFLVERFDRCGDDRIHMEDFGQILDRPPGNHQYHGRYEELAEVLRWVSPDSVAEFIRLIAFIILSGNGDAHLKNFSLLYDPATCRAASLSPAYDLVATILYYSPKKEGLALQLGETKAFSSITSRSFDQIFGVADEVGIDGSKVFSETLEAVLTAFESAEVQHNFTREEIERLKSHIACLSLTD